MSKAQYDIYINKVMDLAKTMVIKSNASVNAINRELLKLGHSVNEADPTTQKYYLNLNGEYHSTDRSMSVTSLDTLQSIAFTKQNLSIHKATAREYSFGTKFYNELVSKYPDQETLILGILHPIAMEAAIAAVDGEILWYDPTLIEDNESNLIPRLSAWSKGFMVRWDLAAYGLTDDLYPAAQLAVLYMGLPSQILNIRLSNCHTLYAHTYHIREFLASNGRLDVYIDNLTKKQMLWLYRNVRYIHRNSGKKSTFNLLMQNILTDRGLPIAEWNMRHNLSTQIEDIYPTVEFVRKPLNFGFNTAGTDTRDIPQLLDVEQPVAKDNVLVQPAAEIEIAEAMENSLQNELQTKVLESSVIDLNDATAFTLSDALLNHWLYLAHLGRYKAVITVDNPKTGGKLTFSTTEAFIVFLYSYNLARGTRLVTIPTVEAINVRRLTPPTRTELRGVVDRSLVGEELIEAAYLDLAPVDTYVSTLAFREAVIAINKTQLWHRELYATREHFVEKGLVQQMVGRFYQDAPCSLGGNTSYADWFTAFGLDIPTFTELEADLLANQLLSAATGADLTINRSLKDMQGAMLRLMSQLSSYSIQFLQSINSSPVQVLDWGATRAGDCDVLGRISFQADILDRFVQGGIAVCNDSIFLDISEIGENYRIDDKVNMAERLSLDIEIGVGARDVFHIRGEISNISVMSINQSVDVIGTDTPNLATLDYVQQTRIALSNAFLTLQSTHFSLDPQQRQTLADRWAAFQIASGAALSNSTLAGITYPEVTALATSTLDGINYPPLAQLTNATLDGIYYPDLGALSVPTLDGITFP